MALKKIFIGEKMPQRYTESTAVLYPKGEIQ